MKIWKSKAGMISKEPVWCCYWGGYLYMHETLLELILQMIYEWKDEHHIVG